MQRAVLKRMHTKRSLRIVCPPKELARGKRKASGKVCRSQIPENQGGAFCSCSYDISLRRESAPARNARLERKRKLVRLPTPFSLTARALRTVLRSEIDLFPDLFDAHVHALAFGRIEHHGRRWHFWTDVHVPESARLHELMFPDRHCLFYSVAVAEVFVHEREVNDERIFHFLAVQPRTKEHLEGLLETSLLPG